MNIGNWETISVQPCLVTRTSFFFTQQESTSPNHSSQFCPWKPAASCLRLLHKIDFKYQISQNTFLLVDDVYHCPAISQMVCFSKASLIHNCPSLPDIAHQCLRTWHPHLLSFFKSALPTTGRELLLHTVCTRDYLLILHGITEKVFHNFTILLVHSTTLNVPKLNHELF